MENNTLNVKMSSNDIEAQRSELIKKAEKNVNKVEFDAKNYLNLELKPGEKTKKIRVRILNITPQATTPFLVLKTHSLKVDKQISKSGFKSFICLEDKHLTKHDERGCPLCQETKKYFDKSNKCNNEAERKSLFKLGCQYQSKDTFIVRVIDREHEDEGVKFWRFNAHSDGSGCYDKLMAIYDERMKESIEQGQEPFNVFDLNNGKDFTITISATENSNKVTYDIIDAGFPSPLSKDVNKALEWINDTKTWGDIYSVKPYEYLNVIVNNGIPVYDKDKKCFVNKHDYEIEYKQKINEIKSIENEALRTLNNTDTMNNKQDTNGLVTEDSLSDDLPF